MGHGATQNMADKRTATSTPTGLPKFKCNYLNCSFSSRRMALLKNHMRNHNQEKPQKCSFCSYRTQSRSNLKVHERRMHTFQRPHKCHYCTYSCVQSTTLRQHVQIKHKERCQYHCFQCRNFYCQRESQLMFHLLKVHQISAIGEISPYLNPIYLPDHVYPVQNVPPSGFNTVQGESRAFVVGSTASNPQKVQLSQNQVRQKRQYSGQTQKTTSHVTATPFKLTRVTNPNFQGSSIATSTPMRPSQSFIPQSAESLSSPTGTLWMSSGHDMQTQYQRKQQGTQQVGLNDLSDHSFLASSSLISPLEDEEDIIDMTENEDESDLPTEEDQNENQQRQDDGSIYVCNQCLSTFADERSYMNHLIRSHGAGTAVEQGEINSDTSHQQEGSRQDTITSSDSLSYVFSGNKPTAVESSPGPIPISQEDFAVPPAVKQEGEMDPQGERERCVSHLQQGDLPRERHTSDSVFETTFPSTLVQRSASVASHDSSLGQVASGREGTPLLDMPSPTTTHSNRITASTQTAPSADNRGGLANQAKYCCVHCNIVFPDSVLYTIHRGAHGFHSPFECNFCGMDCINKYEFASHLHNCS